MPDAENSQLENLNLNNELGDANPTFESTMRALDWKDQWFKPQVDISDSDTAKVEDDQHSSDDLNPDVPSDLDNPKEDSISQEINEDKKTADPELEESKKIIDSIEKWSDKNKEDTNKITKLTPELAEELVKKSGISLKLDWLKTLDLETAKKLKKPLMSLSMNWLTSITSEVAEAIATSASFALSLNGLESIDSATAASLAKHKLWSLSLNWLTELDKDVAQELWKHEWMWLILNWLTKIDPDVANWLINMREDVLYKTLVLDGLQTVDLDTANVLVKHKWKLVMHGLLLNPFIGKDGVFSVLSKHPDIVIWESDNKGIIEDHKDVESEHGISAEKDAADSVDFGKDKVELAPEKLARLRELLKTMEDSMNEIREIIWKWSIQIPWEE